MDMTKSAEIKAGLQKSFHSESSAKASTVCFGYRVTNDGVLGIYPPEAIIVIHIFDRFAAGDSLGQISASLARMNIPTPTGKEVWSRETIAKLLNNEKYTGDVILGKTEIQNGVQIKSHDPSLLTAMRGHHEAIISRDLFNQVQQEKVCRSRGKHLSHER